MTPKHGIKAKPARKPRPLTTPFAGLLNNSVYTRFSTSATAVAQDRPTRRLRQLLYGVTALAVFLTAATIWGWIRSDPPKQVVRQNLVFDPAEAMIQPVAYFWGRLALSPDGSRLAYVGGPRAQLLVRQRNQLHATAIPGSEGAESPFFSPDGQQVGFVSGGNNSD